MEAAEKLKSRIIPISLGLVLVLSVALTGCAGEEVPEITEYNLTISSTEAGSVTAPGEGSFTFEQGEVVELVAEAEEGYRFINWTGDVGTVADVNAASATITMQGDYEITANFEEDKVVTFPDLDLESAIRQTIAIPERPIYALDMERLTALDAEERGISDLTGLEYATNLRSLRLANNQISDISPLASLTKLTNLRLWNNQINNISLPANLTNLRGLDLGDNRISDISPVVNFTSLTTLGLYSNQIGDIFPLANLANLEYLSLEFNQISDISPLANLTSLTALDLAGNQISDISPLVNNAGLSRGDKVYLSGNPLNSMSINTYIPELRARGVVVEY
jgi:internalin A